MTMGQPAERAAGGAMLTLSRREAIVLAGGGVVAVSLVNPAAATVPTDVRFDVYRKGSAIGTHVIRFSQTGGTLKVASQVDIQVKVAFITVYRYEQTGNDDWENDVLVRTRIQTNDDGNDTLVVAEARDGQLAVEGPAGSYTTQLGAMTDSASGTRRSPMARHWSTARPAS